MRSMARSGCIRLREYPGRVSGTELWTPDLIKYAEAFGGLGIRIESDSDAPAAVAEALAYDGIVVIDVAVSRDTIAPGLKLSSVG